MTTDYELHNLFEVLNKAKRNSNFGTTAAQRSRAQAGETARFEQNNSANVGTVASSRNATGSNYAPSTASSVVTPRKPAKPTNPLKPDVPKKSKGKTKKPTTSKTKKPTTIDGNPEKKKPKPRSADNRRASGSAVQSAYEKQIASLQRAGRRSTVSPRSTGGIGTSQAGVDPRSSRARAAYINPKTQEKVDAKRKKDARAASAAASKKDTYRARKIQQQAGVISKNPKKKVKKIKTKSACPLIKTELNGAFNNLLDNFQQLYK